MGFGETGGKVISIPLGFRRVAYWGARVGWLRVPHPLHPAGTGPAHPWRGEGDGVIWLALRAAPPVGGAG